MMRYWFLVLVGAMVSFASFAQKISVESFSLAATDISAQTQPRKDLNDAPCALVKVQFVGDILDVEGNVIKPLGKKNYETWVYLTHGSRQMQVTAKNYLPLMIKFADYGVESVEKNRTYVLVLSQAGASSNQNDVPSTNSASPTQRPTSIATPNDIITIPVKDGISIDMVKVEAGTFMMGATSEDNDAEADEKPIHQVALTKDYYIGKYEVSQKLWRTVMGENAFMNKEDNLPMGFISWSNCQKFISKLNHLTGRKFRLPTEAEWEYAARGGKKNRGYKYSGSDNILEVAWYSDNSGGKTHPVGTKHANELGICDMTGNVWEWCQDYFDYYKKELQTNPTGAKKGSHVLRGGSSWSGGESCRISNRFGYVDAKHYQLDFGFRLVLSE